MCFCIGGKKVSCKYSLGTIIKAPLWHVSVDIYFPLTEDQNYSLIIHRVLKRYYFIQKVIDWITGKVHQAPIHFNKAEHQTKGSLGRGEDRRATAPGRDVTAGRTLGTQPGSPFSAQGGRFTAHSCKAVSQPGSSMGVYTGHRSLHRQSSALWLPFTFLPKSQTRIIPSRTNAIPKSPGTAALTQRRHKHRARAGHTALHPREGSQRGVCPRGEPAGLGAVSDVWRPLPAPPAAAPGKSCPHPDTRGVSDVSAAGLCGNELNRTLQYAIL